MNLFRLTEEYLVEHYPNRAEKVADGVVHGIGLTAATVGGLAIRHPPSGGDGPLRHLPSDHACLFNDL